MKLAVITPYPPHLGGISTYGFHVCNALALTGEFSAIDIIAPEGQTGAPEQGALSIDPAPQIRVQRVWRYGSIDAVPRIVRAVIKTNADVVWISTGLSGFGKGLVANAIGALLPSLLMAIGFKVVTTVHHLPETTDPAQLKFPLARALRPLFSLGTRLAYRGQRQVCLSSLHAQMLSERYRARHLTVIRHPTYYRRQQEHSPDPKAPTVLFFGVVAPFKGLVALIEAFEEIHRSNPQVRLTIAGSTHPRFPGYFAELQAHFRGLSGVQFLENVPEEQIAALFSKASLLVLPYAASSGVSGVVHNASSFGIPIIVTDLPELRRVNQEEGLHCIWCRTPSALALRNCIEATLLNLAEETRLAGANISIAEQHSLPRTAASYLGVFRELLCSPPQRSSPA